VSVTAAGISLWTEFRFLSAIWAAIWPHIHIHSAIRIHLCEGYSTTGEDAVVLAQYSAQAWFGAHIETTKLCMANSEETR
jgi:hypothetical protein